MNSARSRRMPDFWSIGAAGRARAPNDVHPVSATSNPFYGVLGSAPPLLVQLRCSPTVTRVISTRSEK